MLVPRPCPDPRRAVTGGRDKGPLFPLSVFLSLPPAPRPGNGANKALSQGQGGRHEAEM